MSFVRYDFLLFERKHFWLLLRCYNKKQTQYFSHLQTITEYVERQCDSDGNWAIRENSTRAQYPNGWTNFTPCYTDDMKKLLDKLGNEDAAQVCLLFDDDYSQYSKYKRHNVIMEFKLV